MNRYEYAFRIVIFSFSLILVALLVLNFLPENSVQEIEASIAANLVFASIAAACGLSGTYLWLTGFSRFKATIGYYGFKWLIYVSFNMLAAVYLHWKYKRTTTNKVV